MKDKIIAALKTTYAKLGLSDKAFDGVAALLEKTVTEEAQIATVVGGDDVRALLTAIQGQVDSFRNKLSDKEKELNDYKEKHPEGNPPTPPTGGGDEEPEWAKKLRESNERIEARFKADDEAKKLSATLTSVEAKLKAAGCVNPGILKGVLKGFALGENETEDQAVTRLQKDYNDSYLETFGEGVPPGLGSGGGAPDAKTVTDVKNQFLREQGLLPEEKK